MPPPCPEGWTASGSDQSAGHPAEAVLDSNAFTYWDARVLLVQTGPSRSRSPSTCGAPQVVSGLIYEPRQGAAPAGAIGRFEVSVSADGVHFETVATGTWANTTAIKQIGIAPVTTRFVRLTALSTASGSGSDIAAAEIYLRGTPHVAPSGVSQADAVKTDP